MLEHIHDEDRSRQPERLLQPEEVNLVDVVNHLTAKTELLREKTEFRTAQEKKNNPTGNGYKLLKEESDIRKNYTMT